MKTARNAIRLLRQFSTEEPKLGVSELARRLDLDRASVHRMLRTLVEERIVEQEPSTRLYSLGRGVLELAHGFLRQYGIVSVAQPHLEELRNLTGETTGLQILDGRQVVAIATCESLKPLRVSFYVGERVPIHCSSSGTVFLAFMPDKERKLALAGKLQRYSPKTIVNPARLIEALQDVRRRSIAFADETYQSGIRAASAPVLSKGGDVIAVVSLLAPSPRISMRALVTLATDLKRVAQAVSDDLAQSAVTVPRTRQPGGIRAAG